MQYLTRQTTGIFWRHAKKYRWQVIAIIAGILFVPFLQTYIPLKYRDLLNLLAQPNEPGVFAQVLNLLVFILILNLISIAIRRLFNLLTNYFEPAVMRDLMNSCYVYLQQHSFGFFSGTFVGSLVTKVKRYEKSFERLSDTVTYDLGNSLLLTISIIIALFFQFPVFAWIILGWSIVFVLFSYYFAVYKLPWDIKRAAADSHVTGQLADGITNNINVKLFSHYAEEGERFSSVTHQQFNLRRKSANLGTLGDSVQALLMTALEFGGMYLAIRLWRDGVLQVGDVALLQLFLYRIFDKLWNTGKQLRLMFEALADANEMTEILLKPHAVADVPGAVSLVAGKGSIEFKDVTFGYHDRLPVLSNFNLTVQPGERLALIGSSGGGKSTILRLLFRFHNIAGGVIEIDGQNIAEVTQDSLRDVLSLVPQDPILFHRSLMENIRYAKPEATDEQVIEAAKLAHAHEFISAFPQKYDTLVGERGIKLSGGERQRVAIARAILKDAPILVLDEATSSLDSESEKFIQDALAKLMKNRTTIVVAHRLSTIMQMDRIVVISDGKIVEQGRHEELLKVQQGVYQKLWEIQAGSFS
jgi:ATP-binding cassette subfamily B protein